MKSTDPKTSNATTGATTTVPLCPRCGAVVRSGWRGAPRKYCPECRVLVRRERCHGACYLAWVNANRAKIRLNNRRYQRTHPEVVARYRAAHPEQQPQSDRRYRENHIEAYRAQARARSRLVPRNVKLARCRRYREKNREAINARRRSARAALMAVRA